MHIVRLEAENYKRIRAVEITPDGNLVVVSGRNGQGKSSVLHAIWAAIKNAAAGKENPDPIRHGETEARVRVHLGDLVVTRTWKAGKPPKLMVHDSEGRPKRKPQALLDSLVGKISFDPTGFLRLKAADQRAELLKLVVLSFDLDELEARHADLFARRTEAGRVTRVSEGEVEKLAPVSGDTPPKVSVTDLSRALTLSMEKHERARFLRSEVELCDLRFARASAELTAARAELKKCEEVFENCSVSLAGAKADADKIPTGTDEMPSEGNLGDPVAIQAKIAAAVEANALHDEAIRNAARRKQVEAEAEAAREHYQELHQAIDAIEEEKATGLKAAVFPVDGLSFSDDGVLYNDIPFVQCCASEQLKVSVAMAMALNPTIRVILVEDGSLLDEESMGVLEEMAIEHDCQVWVEVVGEGESGVLIEDGQVIA